MDGALAVPLHLFNRFAAPPVATPTVSGGAYIVLSAAAATVIQVASASAAVAAYSARSATRSPPFFAGCGAPSREAPPPSPLAGP